MGFEENASHVVGARQVHLQFALFFSSHGDASMLPMSMFLQANKEGMKATNEKDGFKPPIILLGAALSVLTYATPFVVYWSTGSNPKAFNSVYTNTDFISSGITTLAWLLFSLCQLYGANRKIVGDPAVYIHSIGIFIYCTVLVFKLSPDGIVSDVACLIGVISPLAMVIILMVGLSGFLKREHKIAKIISSLAALAQVVSSLVLYGDLCCIRREQAPDAQVPRIINRRKLVVYIRSLDAGFKLYWAVYCMDHYDNTYFWITNITSVILSWIAAYNSILVALRPVVGEYEAETFKGRKNSFQIPLSSV
ncbi:uncharacterized protein LOC102712481 isoform X2 [Oryza brachyantha]|uniref:uncharacterized protein LOC102712481 isoform X2 n=1 Tax=Oryza brachyantha TaxID=4533 RepID=UPI0003EAD09A|nr:uncharacterized protein LOC102712481 isoform X2 [Oryza brachyantha]